MKEKKYYLIFLACVVGIIAATLLDLFSNHSTAEGELPKTGESPRFTRNREDTKQNLLTIQQGEAEAAVKSEDSISLISTPADAAAVLNALRIQQPDLSSRAIDSARAICSLVEHGYVDEAWRMIDENPGLVRDQQISWFMAMDVVSIEARFEKLNQLENKEARSSLKSVIDSMDPQQLLDRGATIAQMVKPEMSGLLRKFTSDRVTEYLKFAVEVGAPDCSERVQAALRDAESLVRTNQISPVVYAGLYNEYSGLGAFERWNHLRTIPECSLDQPGAKDLREQSVSSMISSDAPRAMATLLDESSSYYDQENVVAAITTWYRDDSRSANDWVIKNVSRLKDEQHDSVVAAVAKVALKETDKSTAIQWANSIKDPKLRQQLISAAK